MLCIGALSLGLLAGCSPSTTTTQENEISKGKVTIGYVNWADNIAVTNLAKVILEQKMGYEVETKQGEAGMVFTSVANGDMDFFLDAWMPVTHKDYMEKYGENLDQYGPILEGAKIGLVVPEYMDINSIEELNSVKDELEGKITGIDPGAGIMKTTEKAIEEYGLDYELLEGSGATMTAMIKKAEDEKNPIVVTGWFPHWKFARWDLKFLEDPKKVYGEAENVYVVTRKGFAEDQPEVIEFIKKLHLDDQQLADLMEKIQNNSDQDPYNIAENWVDENEDLVNTWLPE